MIEGSLVATYENISAVCDHCGKRSVFNRRSDLKSLDLVSGLDVVCLNAACAKVFRMYGDLINPAFEMFVFDCYPLYELKHYAFCITSLTQAWETFFANYLRVELAYKPYASSMNIEKLNSTLLMLYTITRKSTYAELRNIFINMCIKPVRDIDVFVDKFVGLKSKPPKEALSALNFKIKEKITALYDSELGELRNKIIHKSAYRPHRDEVDKYLEETRNLLLPLGSMLDIRGDDVNYYVHRVSE